MLAKRFAEIPGRRERGATLLTFAVALVMLIGIAGLAIDLGALYVGRSEAQRAADAGALAGAQALVDSGFTSGVVSGAAATPFAQQRAVDEGNKNFVGGQSPNIQLSDVSVNTANGGGKDPLVTVTVTKTMPTYFMKIFGVTSKVVSTLATAEAFNPSGQGIPVGTKCLKPWLLANCDPDHTFPSGDSRGNPNCPVDAATNAARFIDASGNIVFPGAVSSGGVVGELLIIKPGDPTGAAGPSKFYPVYLPPGAIPSSCPSCATGSGGGGPSSGSLYRNNIACCNQSTIVCGLQTVQPITGNMVGPTALGVDCLIHEDSGSGSGQDILDTSSLPFKITAGSNNPFAPAGTPVSSSDSVVTVPLYDGTTLCPGGSCPETINVNIVGFMQIFVKDETNPQGTVEAYIMNVAGCSGGGSGSGGGGSGGGGVVFGGGGSPIPVRLIRP